MSTALTIVGLLLDDVYETSILRGVKLINRFFNWRLFVLGVIVAFLATEAHEVGHIIPALFYGGRFRFSGLDAVYVLPSRTCIFNQTCVLQDFLSDIGGPLVSLAIMVLSFLAFIKSKNLGWLSGLYVTNYFLSCFWSELDKEIGSDLNKVSEILNINPLLTTGTLALGSILILVFCFTKIKSGKRFSTVTSYLFSSLFIGIFYLIVRRIFGVGTSELFSWLNS